jgi:filamentous hemagglutinin family protein
MRFRPASGSVGPTSSSRLALALSSLALAPITVLPPPVYANLPTGAQVVHGNVAITQAGGAMNIQQASRNAIVNWQSFNIGAGNRVQINQGGANAAMLARVVGGDASQLLGSLKADGKLFLINQRGVIVGEGATIDTAGFMASTLDVSDAEFLAGGAMTFKGDSDAGIVNLGKITASEGNVMLFAHTVKNAGEISAPKGTAALAAGTEMFLASPDDASVIVKVNLPRAKEAAVGVENSGTIVAAQAELKAAGGSIYNLAINQTGMVRAGGVERRNGRVILTAAGGTVGVSGTVTATNADGSGGEVLIGGDYRGENKDVPNAARTVVTKDAVIDVSATAANGDGGRAIVWADESTRFLGTLAARGGANAGDGGFAEVSGKRFLDFNPRGAADLSARNGEAGTLLLDPAALTISAAADSGTATSGTDPFVFGVETEPAVLDVATLEAQLATSHVTIETSELLGDVSFDVPVAWSSANTLRVNSFNDILINADLTAENGALELYPAQAAMLQTQEQDGPSDFIPRAILDANATLTVNRLTYGTNDAPLPAGWTGEGRGVSASFDGNLNVGTLEIDLANGGTGVGVFGSNNTIGAVRTIGTGNLGYFFVENHHGDLRLLLDSPTSSAAAIVAITPGTLTIEAGSKLAFDDATDVILASTGAGFINLAGGDVFGSNARFLIYAADSTATSKGGLVGSSVFEHVFDLDDDFSGDTQSRFLFANESGLPMLTYTADSLSRLYGAANPTFTATVTGLLGADLLTDVVTGLPVFSTTALQSSGVGSYAIDVARGTLSSEVYDFAFASGTLTIERAPLTITADDASRRLNRENPDFTATYTGLVNDEPESVVSGLEFSTTADLSSPAGDYEITVSGATAANYEITFVEGTLTVAGVATLNITADDVTRLYGTTNPAFTATITGFEDDDNASIVSGLEFATNATQRSGVGTYTITPFGATAAGYEIDYTGGTLTIERAPLTITASTVNRVYGDENPTFTANFSGLVNDDTSAVVSGLAFETSATKRSNVGSYGLNVSGGTADNYAITHAPGAVNVTPATLVVKADDLTRVYGDPNPTPTISVTGLKNDDRLEDVVFIASGPTHFATETSGIGAYGIILQGFGSSSNYNATVQSGSMTITQRPLTIVADNKTKVYGDPNPEFTATYRGLASFDSPAAIPNVRFSTQATQSSGVSTFGILVTSDLSQNYKIGYEFGQLQITPAELVITGLTDLSRVYGRADPALPTVGAVGLKNSDTLAMVGLEFAVPAPTVDAGDHKYSVTARNSNYTLLGNEANFIVEPAPLTLQVKPIVRLYGDSNPANVSMNVTGLAFGQTAEQVLRIDNPTNEKSDVGTYNLFPELLTQNYVLNDISGNTVRINPRYLTIDVDNHARYYGDATPEFTYVLGGDGLPSFESASAVFADVRTAVPIDERTDVGWYRIDPIFTNNANYLVSWSPGYLAIMPRPIEVTVHNGVSFGNNNVPVEFDADALGLNLILFDPNGSGGLGYTADVKGLPSFATMDDVLPNLYYELRSENVPQGIGEAVDLASITFPARPSRTPPQPTTEPPPDSLPGTIVEFKPGQIVVPDTAAPVTYSEVIVLNGTLTLGPTLILPNVPTKDTTKDRFADVTRYIIPRAYQANNYVVTKVTNGVLTMKADPVIKAETLEREAAAAKRKEDRDKFYMNRTAAPGEILLTQHGAYGLTADLMPSLRSAIGFFLNQEIVNGLSDEAGALAVAINGGLQVKSWDDLPEDKIMAFLADIHTNPEKQALVMPALMQYTMNVAMKAPGQRDAQEQKLMAHIMPALDEARGSFIDAAKDARDSWAKTEGAARGATLAALFDGKVPYDDFVAKAVGDTMGEAMQRFETKAEEFDARNAKAVAEGVGAVAGGAGAGAIVGMTMGLEKVVTSVFPFAKATVMRTLQKAGEKVAAEAVSKGIAKIGSSAAGGAGTIVSLAVTILITESIAVAENEEARKNFDALLNSGKDPIDPNAMMKSDQGKAIMLLGLSKLFLGGDTSGQKLSTNFDLN